MEIYANFLRNIPARSAREDSDKTASHRRIFLRWWSPFLPPGPRGALGRVQELQAHHTGRDKDPVQLSSRWGARRRGASSAARQRRFGGIACAAAAGQIRVHRYVRQARAHALDCVLLRLPATLTPLSRFALFPSRCWVHPAIHVSSRPSGALPAA
jgi:hypothetical protein